MKEEAQVEMRNRKSSLSFDLTHHKPEGQRPGGGRDAANSQNAESISH